MWASNSPGRAATVHGQHKLARLAEETAALPEDDAGEDADAAGVARRDLEQTQAIVRAERVAPGVDALAAPMERKLPALQTHRALNKQRQRCEAGDSPVHSGSPEATRSGYKALIDQVR